MDYLPPERERGITISSAVISLPWGCHTLNLVDTPGHADFTFEVERVLHVLDGAVALLDASAGVEVRVHMFRYSCMPCVGPDSLCVETSETLSHSLYCLCEQDGQPQSQVKGHSRGRPL